MPLLGGIFKRDKQSSSRNASSSHAPATPQSTASVSSAKESIETDYVLPDRSLPRPVTLYSGPPGSSSSKIKLPFRRNRHAHPPDTSNTSQAAAVSLNDVPLPSSVVSDSGHGLPPPPSKSSIFGVYHNDRNSNSNSTPSFSNEHSHSHFHTDTPSSSSLTDARSEAHSSPCTSPPPKKSSLFSWARPRKSKTSESPSTLSSPPSVRSGSDHSSFNLQAFRHLPPGNPSTESKENSTATDYSLPPPRPRPRGDSATSDSSQRISVAAFREAQARKSRANSPVPSFRPPSAADTLRLDVNNRQRASTVSVVSGMGNSRSIRNSTAQSSTRPNSSALQSSSDSSESSEDDEDVDSDSEPAQKLNRERTITHRGPAIRTQSEIGHGSLREDPPNSVFARQPRADPLKASQSNAPYTPRTRASASTSALTPDAAARRASTLASMNSASASPASVPRQVPQKQQPQKNDDSDTSSDSSDSDSDLPLSALVPPKRPGSSASVSTNKSSRVPPKPLIDIKTLVGSPPVLAPVLRHENSIKAAKGKERDADKDEPFSPPPMLKLSSSFVSDSPSASSAKGHRLPGSSKQELVIAHHRRMSSEATVAPSVKSPSDSDDDLINAIRLVSSLDLEREKEKEKEKASSPSGRPSGRVSQPERTSTASDRIIPTPIRERQPPSSFAVVSRPPQRTSTGGILQSLSSSPTSPFSAVPLPASTSPPPVISPRSTTGVGPRPRSTTLVNLPSSTDKSDTKSNASSASRSSRIPAVPLIHSIPDSPSVKADYKASSSHSTIMKQRATSAGPPDTRSRPQSGTLISLSPTSSSPASSSTRNSSFVPYPSQSLMPQRPFASNSFVRGESPAPSSTGDSSSNGPPFTPRDGSEIGVRLREGGSDVGSTLKARPRHDRRPSVTFEDIPGKGRERVRERAKSEAAEEERRSRRRSEAKAAIEFGKLVNSRGPLIRNDSDDELAPGGRHMGGGMTPNVWAPWQQQMGTGMSSMAPTPQFNDPAFVAAHQRAMMYAKQAYQMAVAQHAIALAGEEWERGSNARFGSGGSAYGGSSASVYGGGGMAIRPPGPGMGMMGMPNMGMLIPPGQWHGSPVMFPSAASIYGGGISSTQSEFGGAGGWASKSAYGDSFGPSPRSSYLHPGHGAHGSSASAYGGSAPRPGPAPRQRAQTGAAPPPSSTSSRSPGRSRVPPPSSWKNAK